MVSEKMTEQGLVLSLKVPPLAGVASQPGPHDPVFADGQGKVDLLIPTAVVPPGKAKITIHIQPAKGSPWSIDYVHEREARLARDGVMLLPVLEGVECAAILALEPGAQVLWQGCPTVRHVINGKPVGQEVEHLAFGDVLGDLPLEQLLPVNGRLDYPTAEVQATAVATRASAHGPVPVMGDWRTGLRDYFVKTAGKPMVVGGEELPNDNSLALVIGSPQSLLVLGSGPLRELDLVAIYEPRAEKPVPLNCSAAPCAPDGGGDLILSAFAADVTLYDRRTGAVLEKKFFPIGSTTACPGAAMKGRLENGSPASIVEVIKWLEPRLVKKGP